VTDLEWLGRQIAGKSPRELDSYLDMMERIEAGGEILPWMERERLEDPLGRRARRALERLIRTWPPPWEKAPVDV